MKFHSSLLAFASVPALIAPAFAAVDATAPAQELVARVTPDFAPKVTFALDSKATQPTLSTKDGKLLVTAADIHEAIRAYGYYLRNLAHVHFSWNGNNADGAAFVLPKQPVIVPPSTGFNYALNYCTLSYSCTHWDKKRWEHELDVFALNGYSHILVTAGLEKVWKNFLTEIGYPAAGIDKFIPNPAFGAWWNMGNLEGEGGPLSPVIMEEEAALGKFIVHRMLDLGMEPVMQGYVGFLPRDIDPASLNGKLLPQGGWVAGYMRPTVIDPTSADYPKLAAIWYKHLAAVYGYRGKFFGGDLFHEGGNTGGANLTECAKVVQSCMQKAVPGSTWVLQGWAHNPHKALLDGTDPAHTIVLLLDKDLRAEHDPYYKDNGYLRRTQLIGAPSVWCELSNFGGNHGLFGGFGVLEQFKGDVPGLMGELAGKSLGLGMISEGVETNPLFYALLTERMNNKGGNINREQFLKTYAKGRYGSDDPKLVEALAVLAESVYKPTTMREGCQESILCARPKLDAVKASTWSDGKQYYDYAEPVKAAKLLLAAGKADKKLAARETYIYDLADVTRQVLADRARVLLPEVKAAYDAKDAAAFKAKSDEYLKLITDTAEMLATSEHFLLGAYLKGAEDKGGKDEEARRQMRVCLKRLITTWAKGNTSLNDYAHRQLSELMSQYYHARWSVFFAEKNAELNGGKAPAAAAPATGGGSVSNNGMAVSFSYEQNAGVDDIQNAFPEADTPLLLKPQGDAVKIAEEILKAY